MITLFVDNCNPISQGFYDHILAGIQFHQLRCSCGHAGCLSRHAYYYRTVRTINHSLRIRICRVICSECGATHALLLSSMVPYSQLNTEDQLRIISSYLEGDPVNTFDSMEDDGINENLIKSIIRRFRTFWKERLRAESIPLSPLGSLIRGCFSSYSLQFMQIKCTFNSLFLNTT